MNTISPLLPKNRNNPISFCAHQAKVCVKSKSLLVSLVAARCFAALTPVAALVYGISSIVKGITHAVVIRINPKWAAEHADSWEDIKTGLKCIVLVAAAVAYAAGAVLLGSYVIDLIPNPVFEFTQDRNRKNLIEMSKSNPPIHLIAHEGCLIQRPTIPFVQLELQNEVVEILWETHEIARAKNDKLLLEAIQKVVGKTNSTSSHIYWTYLLNAVNNNYPPKPSLNSTIEAILAGKPTKVHVFSKDEVIKCLNLKYSQQTVSEVVKFYTDDSFIPTRVIHAILIGIQANLTILDVYPPTPARLREMRKELPVPRHHYSDPHYIQLRKEIYFMSYLQYADCYKPIENDPSPMRDYRDFGFAEFLARFIAYPLYGTGEDNWRLDFTDKREPKYVQGTLFSCYHNKEEVLMSIAEEIAAPGLRMLEVSEVDNKFGATLFRGTSDLQGLNRDFEWEGVGRRSYEKNKDRMLKIFLNSPKPSEWHIAGHSLGAADAQRYLHTLVKAVPEDKLPSNLHLWTFNSPKIETDIGDDFIEEIKSINKQRAKLKPFTKKDALKVKIRHIRTIGDLVQMPGKILLGNDATAEDGIDVSSIFVKLPWFIRTWRERHTASVFSTFFSPNGQPNLSNLVKVKNVRTSTTEATS